MSMTNDGRNVSPSPRGCGGKMAHLVEASEGKNFSPRETDIFFYILFFYFIGPNPQGPKRAAGAAGRVVEGT